MAKYFVLISLFFSLFLFTAPPCYPASDTPIFDHFTISDGLSNNSINDILQTHDGYIWIATKDGLNRYDGQNFKIFKRDLFDSTSVPENYIMCLIESRDSTLWVGTWGGGLCRFDPAQEQFVRYDHSDPADDYIQCLFQDRDDHIWYGTTRHGINRLDPKTRQITTIARHIDRPAHFPSDNVSSITADKNGWLWLATLDAGVIHFNPADHAFQQYAHHPDAEHSLSINVASHVFNDRDRILWISTDLGINQLDLQNRRIDRQLGIPENLKSFLTTPIRQTLRDSRGRLWIGTYEYRGLLLVEEKDGLITRFRHLRHEDDDPGSLISDRIRWLYEDHRKNIWIGTEDGLDKLPASQPFHQLKYMPMRPSTLGGRIVSSICPGRDSLLWIGYNGAGFDRYDLRNQKITHFKPEPGNPNALSEEDVITIYEDEAGILWIGTSRGGLNRYDPSNHVFRHYLHQPANPASLRSNWVQQILETRQGLFLVGTNDGLQIFDKKKNTFTTFSPAIENGPVSFPENISVNALFEDGQGEIWIGTWLDGLYRYIPGSKSLHHYAPDPNDSLSLSSNKITSISEDSRGWIWIATHSGGMNCFDKNRNCFTSFTTQNGLPNDVVFALLEDNRGMLWASTLKGLVRVDPLNRTFRIYDTYDGLINNQFNWRASCKTRSGLMYFGGIDGLVYFHPDSVKLENVPPPLVIQAFKIFNKESALPHVQKQSAVKTLQHYENFFSIEYAALDIAPQHKHRYAYKLEGIDPDWVQAGSVRTASYTDIDPGSYRFFVKACNADGVWSEPVSLAIRILPAWWMTWMFKVFIALSILVALLLFFRYRLHHLMEIQRIRLNIASDLHDEIGSNLSSISVETQLLLSAANLDGYHREQLNNISETARETIDAIRDIVWFINPKNDMTKDLILKLQETASRLLVGIHWTLNSSPEIRFDEMDIELRRNIYLIYKEALTNIVRHSGATTCSIKLFETNAALELVIVDNGRGFDSSRETEESGLLNMRRRATRIKAQLAITSHPAQGTQIRLTLPRRKK